MNDTERNIKEAVLNKLCVQISPLYMPKMVISQCVLCPIFETCTMYKVNFSHMSDDDIELLYNEYIEWVRNRSIIYAENRQRRIEE